MFVTAYVLLVFQCRKGVKLWDSLCKYNTEEFRCCTLNVPQVWANTAPVDIIWKDAIYKELLKNSYPGQLCMSFHCICEILTPYLKGLYEPLWRNLIFLFSVRKEMPILGVPETPLYHPSVRALLGLGPNKPLLGLQSYPCEIQLQQPWHFSELDKLGKRRGPLVGHVARSKGR